MVRFAGRDRAACLADAELFDREPGHFCLLPLVAAGCSEQRGGLA